MHYNITTDGFEWDEAKNRINQKKHRISFELATTIFEDPLHLSIPARESGEDRWITIGRCANEEILVVVHTDRAYQDQKEFIRLISARRATKREKIDYEEGI